jgi:hypothetical protein
MDSVSDTQAGYCKDNLQRLSEEEQDAGYWEYGVGSCGAWELALVQR